MNRSGRTVLTCAIVAAAVFGVAGCGVAAQREPVRLDTSVLAPPATPTVTVVAEAPGTPSADTTTAPVPRTAPTAPMPAPLTVTQTATQPTATEPTVTEPTVT